MLMSWSATNSLESDRVAQPCTTLVEMKIMRIEERRHKEPMSCTKLDHSYLE